MQQLSIFVILFYVLISVESVYSQFIINSNHNPVIGDTLNFIGVDTTDVVPGPGGANQTWNFSGIMISSEILFERFISPSSTPYFSYFPNSNMASVTSNTPPVYNYYQISDSGWLTSGYAGSGYKHVYCNPVTAIHYPISYGSQYSSQWAGILTSGNIVNKSSGFRTSSCDGYGSLILPSGTFNVMRVTTTESRIDTGKIGDSILWIRHENSITCDWFETSKKFSVFQIGIWNFNQPPYNSKTVYLRTRNAPVTIRKISETVPAKIILYQNYPNPFNPATNIRYQVSVSENNQTTNVKLVVYDILGKVVTTLVNGKQPPGIYEADWNASEYSGGIYFYSLRTDEYSETRKMILLK